MNNIIDIEVSEDAPYYEDLEIFVRNCEGDTFLCDICQKVANKFLGIIKEGPRIDICEDCLKNIVEKFKDLDKW